MKSIIIPEHCSSTRASASNNPLMQYAIALLFALSLVQFSNSPAADGNASSSTESNATTANEDFEDIVYPDWFKTSFMELEEDIIEAQEADKRLMLVFHQPGCPYCNAFVEQNLSQVDIEETVKNNFDVIEINMWGDLEVVNVDGEEFTEKTFAEYLEVQFTPTVLMYHSDGSIAMRINGFFPPDRFRSALDYVMNEDTDAKSFNEYLAAVKPELLDASLSNTNTPVAYDYFKQDNFTAKNTVLLPGDAQEKPYILLFEQRDCANCVQFHSTVLAEEEIHGMLKEFDVFRIDMWGRDLVRQSNGTELSGRDFAKQLGIDYAPTMVIFSSDHEEVIRSESWLRRFHTKTMFEYTLTGEWKKQPSFQRFIRAKADEIRESGGDVSILE